MSTELPAGADPRELILESYRIEGITDEQCRSIFLDWAIGVPLGVETSDLVEALLAHYGPENPVHPMTQVLKDGLGDVPKAGRRGGRAARFSS